MPKQSGHRSGRPRAGAIERRVRLVLGVAAIVVAAGAANAAGDLAAPVALTSAASSRIAPDYTLGPGDKIRVITFGEESLTGTFVVSAAGRVSLPLIGELQAGGRTTGQVAADMMRMLADGFLKEPRVSIEVVDFRPYYILGEVNKPGLYPYTNGLTVDNAVATAGGFTYRANTHKVYIRPSQGDGERKLPLTSGAVVHPGDTVRIAERYF